MEAFLSKGRLSHMLETVPVNVIMNGKSGLIGAARCAQLKSEAEGIASQRTPIAQTIH
jgi:hypothetical protein